MKMHLRESRTSKFSGAACPCKPPRVEGPLGLQQTYLPVTHLCKNLLKPLVNSLHISFF